MTIKFYKSVPPYGYLNNFTQARMFVYDRWWNNVEAAYQSRKATTPEDVDLIWHAKSPRDARNWGQKIVMRSNWDQIKNSVMQECVLAKFVQHHDLREKLLSTGTEELVEDSPIDYYWGCGADGTGQNMLGKILMSVRELLSME